MPIKPIITDPIKPNTQKDIGKDSFPSKNFSLTTITFFKLIFNKLIRRGVLYHGRLIDNLYQLAFITKCLLLKIKNLLMEWEFTEAKNIEQTLKKH